MKERIPHFVRGEDPLEGCGVRWNRVDLVALSKYVLAVAIQLNANSAHIPRADLNEGDILLIVFTREYGVDSSPKDRDRLHRDARILGADSSLGKDNKNWHRNK